MIAQTGSAHAVSISEYGPPEVLMWSETRLPPLAAHEIRIRTVFAAVNHTDLEIRAGNWPVSKFDPFPYTPGVEAVGVIEEVGDAVRTWVPGQTVITMMQGLGGVRAERQGSYAEFVTVGAEAVALIPSDVDVSQMAALGLVGVTAYEGLRRLGPLAGKRILITGAAGGIGSAATAIAHSRGATVVCLVSQVEQVDYVRALGANDVIVSPRGITPLLEAESVDGVLDAVGGGLFGPCVTALRSGAVLSLVGAVAGGDVAFDAWQLIRPVTLTGYSTETLNGEALRGAVADLSALLATRAIRPPNYQIIPLAEAARAHRLLEKGGTQGRVLLASSRS